MAQRFKPYLPGAASYAPRRTDVEWEQYKPLLIELHNDNVSRTTMQQILAKQGFEVTLPQLHRKMARWNSSSKHPPPLSIDQNGDPLHNQSTPPQTITNFDVIFDATAPSNEVKDVEQPHTMDWGSTAESKENTNDVPVMEVISPDDTLADSSLPPTFYNHEENGWLEVLDFIRRRQNATTYPKQYVTFPMQSVQPKRASFCYCAEFFKTPLQLFSDTTNYSIANFSDFSVLIQPSCHQRWTEQHYVAIVIVSYITKTSKHMLELIHSGLEDLLTLLRKCSYNILAYRLAFYLVKRYQWHSLRLSGHSKHTDTLSMISELENFGLHVQEYDEEIDSERLEFAGILLSVDLQSAFEDCKNILCNNIAYLAGMIRHTKTRKADHDPRNFDRKMTECLEGVNISQISLMVLPLFVASLDRILYHVKLDAGLKPLSLAHLCLFVKTFSLVFAKKFLEEVEAISSNIDGPFGLEHKLLICLMKMYDERWDQGCAQSGQFHQTQSSLSNVISTLREHDDNFVFHDIISISYSPAGRKGCAWLDENISNMFLVPLRLDEDLPNQEHSAIWSLTARVPKQAPLEAQVNMQTPTNTAGEEDNVSMLTCSTKHSFRSFRALAYRLNFASSKASLSSVHSKWSGHMSVDSWQLEKVMGWQASTVES